MPLNTNPELERARRIVETTGTHLFLTGKAGTGKTTFLRRLREDSPKRMVVLAPTGIAAINAGGVTIHSFFQLPFAPYVPGARYGNGQFRMGRQKLRVIRSTDLLVIDEISMVRADLLDAVDAALRRYRRSPLPFGGVQLLLIGDLQQLAPVVKDEEWALLSPHYASPYFFSSRALQQTGYVTIELRTVYRQRNEHFVGLLNRVRENRVDAAVLEELNRRYVPGFRPKKEDGYIRLVTHNIQADRINSAEMDRLPGPAQTYKAEVQGNFPDYAYPTAERLVLKRGAQVMFVKNDTGHRFYNGMIGEVTALQPDKVVVRTTAGGTVAVEREDWTNARYVLSEETQEINEEIEGRFRQMPLKPAWAITIHKSQGLTFEHAIIDAAASFAHGQAYVALSRCKTLEGLVLGTPIPASAIINDRAVEDFTREMQARTPDDTKVEAMQRAFWLGEVSGLFDFSGVEAAEGRLLRVMQEHFYRLYPELTRRFEELYAAFGKRVAEVARRFHAQYGRLAAGAADYAADPVLQDRLRKGAAYFAEELRPCAELAARVSLPTDNKEVKRRAEAALNDLRDVVGHKGRLLRHVAENGFQMNAYLRCKALAAIDDGAAEAAGGDKKTAGSRKAVAKVEVPSDILHPLLYRRLVAWRAVKMKEEGVAAYLVLPQKALLGIANLLPDTPDALLRIPYFGNRSMEKYGRELLAVVDRYVKEKKLKRPDLWDHLAEVAPARPKAAKAAPLAADKPVKKEDTRSVSLRLFREKKSVEAVAAARGLALSTIYSHLSGFVGTGELRLQDLVAPDKMARIALQLLRRKPGKPLNLTELHEALGGDITYDEIRLVCNQIERKPEE